MATINFIRKLIPELNFWVNRTLYNNSLNKDYVYCPTKISDFWRSRDSVVELLFNETADPSGNTYDDGYHFIWKYRTINMGKLHLYEPMLFKRVQVYYNTTWVYAPKDDPKYNDIFNLVDSSVTVDDNYEYPYGIKPTKYVNYKTHIVTTGSDQLHYDDDDEPASESEIDVVVYKEEENVFDLTEEELDMCEYLYYYRTGQYELIEGWEDDFYYTLQSPLSKWVYIYLMCYMFGYVNYLYLKTITEESDGSFRCLVEKHLQDRVYEYLQKHNMTLWNLIVHGCGCSPQTVHKEKRIFKYNTLKNNTFLQKGRFTDDDIDAKCLYIEDIDKNPNDSESFEFIYDGKSLKHGVDFTLENIHTEASPKIKVNLLNIDSLGIKTGEKYQFMYNYVVLKNPITGIKDIDMF